MLIFKKIENIKIKDNNKNETTRLVPRSTEATTPKVNRQKYIINSKDVLTGVLNLTIDKAPIIPKLRAILFPMIVVIAKPIKGSAKPTKIWNLFLNKL